MLRVEEWQTLFSVEAECAATLTGLVFVAVSINLAKIMEAPGLPGRAAESIAQFLQVFFVSSAVLIPEQTAAALGTEILIAALASMTLQGVSQYNYGRMKSGHPRWWLHTRIIATGVSGLPLFVAPILLFTGAHTALYWLMPGFALSFFAGVVNAWILLIEVNR